MPPALGQTGQTPPAPTHLNRAQMRTLTYAPNDREPFHEPSRKILSAVLSNADRRGNGNATAARTAATLSLPLRSIRTKNAVHHLTRRLDCCLTSGWRSAHRRMEREHQFGALFLRDRFAARPQHMSVRLIKKHRISQRICLAQGNLM